MYEEQRKACFSPSGSRIAHPRLWLLGILVLGLVLRWWHVNDPLQQDEFGPLYAIAERSNTAPGMMPTESDPLVPVNSLAEVRERSVLPYGIINTIPLYHYLLYGVIQVLPIAEWSLRLPSVLAGLGCIIGIYYLVRRFMTEEAALVAAVLTAVDPIQIGVSVIARAYALANMACVLTFIFLLQSLRADTWKKGILAALLYGACLALIGFLNPVLLLVGVAHVGVVGWWVWSEAEEKRRPRKRYQFKDFVVTRGFGAGRGLLTWLAGLAVAALLFWPYTPYMRKVQQFSRTHQAYLIRGDSSAQFPPMTALLHNSCIIIALNIVAGMRRVRKWGGRHSRVDGADPPTSGEVGGRTVEGTNAVHTPSVCGALTDVDRSVRLDASEQPAAVGNDSFRQLGILWLITPQVTCLLLLLCAKQPIFLSRYLSYTTLGGALVVSYVLSRERSLSLRRYMTATLVLLMVLWGTMRVSKGVGLITAGVDHEYEDMIRELRQAEADGSWHEGDVVLLRSGFLEGDLLPNEITPDNRQHIQQNILAPVTTLYTVRSPKPITCLSLSICHDVDVATYMGALYTGAAFYNDALASRLQRYRRFWLSTHAALWERSLFAVCFTAWLAGRLDEDLEVVGYGADGASRWDVHAKESAAQVLARVQTSENLEGSRWFLIKRKHLQE